ncbi:ATP-binding protein [Chitinimonas sp. BJYL2]|uniref:PAS domain-containing sensor histidine kinase n=1 Tax=Chitinimonas sp. BJYL2 TaxID=2976696 RepID=UPI0022B532F7|nr:ATP-binding protein [Chitinimonas sp. BJYL2]
MSHTHQGKPQAALAAIGRKVEDMAYGTPPPRLARWLWAMPNLALICFLAVGVAFLLFVRHHEHQRQYDTLVDDLLWQEQTLAAQLDARQTLLQTLANDQTRGELDEAGFYRRAAIFLAADTELLSLAYVNEYGEAVWSYPAEAAEPLQLQAAVIEPIQRAARIGIPASTPTFDYPGAGAAFALAHPAVRGNQTLGAFVAVISVKGLLRQHVPWWIAKRYQISVVDLEGRTLAARPEQAAPEADAPVQAMLFDPPGYGLRLQGQLLQTGWPWWQQVLYGLLGALSVVMLWSLWVLKRHMRERLNAERALVREANLRQAMEDSLTAGVLALDRSGCTLHVNRAFCQMVGLEAAALLGSQPPFAYWPPESHDQCAQAFTAVLRGECPAQGMALRVMRPDGSRLDLRLFASALIDADGQHTGWVASFADVSELQREREALQGSHERFVAVLDGLDASVAVTDCDSGELLMSNRAFREAFDQIDQTGALCVLPLRGEAAEGEWFDAITGRWYQHHRRAVPWVDRPAVWLDIATDVTERKLAADRERQQTDKLQQTARLIALGEIASSLAHELNQPLAAISSYCTACRNLTASGQLSPAELDDALGKIVEQSRRASAIVRGIREFVRKREPQRSPCRVGDLVDTVLLLLSAPLNRHFVRVVRERDADEAILSADPVLLEQVLFNLGKNAIEAMAQAGTDPAELSLQSRIRDGWVDLIVADRGPGIAPDEVEKLFLAFYTTKEEGMGMGLNICRTIVENHDGRLTVLPRPGGGSRFVVSLPLSPQASGEAGSDTPEISLVHRA